MKIYAAMIASALCAAAIASPAAAEAPVAGEIAIKHVHYKDLELTTAAGQAELQRRLVKAAWQVCRPKGNGGMAYAKEQRECYQKARQDVNVKFAAILADFQRGG